MSGTSSNTTADAPAAVAPSSLARTLTTSLGLTSRTATAALLAEVVPRQQDEADEVLLSEVVRANGAIDQMMA